MQEPEERVPVKVSLGWRKVLLFSLLPLLLSVTFLEVGARVLEIWVPPRIVDFGHGFDTASRLFVPDADRPGFRVTHPAKKAAFHGQAFADPKPEGTFRVVVVGESSVYRLSKEIPNLGRWIAGRLAGRVREVEIINAGGMSYGSQRLVPVTAEMVGYQPDLVLVYMGHNEFEEVEQLTLASVETQKLREICSASAAFRFFRDRLGLLTVRRWEHEHNQRVLSRARPDWARAWKHRFTPEDVEKRMKAFRNNLASIIRLCQTNGIPVVVGTVPSNLMKPALAKEQWEAYGEVWDLLERREHEKAAARGKELLSAMAGRHQSSPLENGIIRSLAAQYAVPLADVEAAVTAAEPHHVPGETLFADHCHLNDAGNRLLVETYRKTLEQVLTLAKR